jgi:hypothetical protein
MDQQSLLQKFDQLHAKYLVSPRDIPMDLDAKYKTETLPKQGIKLDKLVKKDKESFRTKMVNIVM